MEVGKLMHAWQNEEEEEGYVEPMKACLQG